MSSSDDDFSVTIGEMHTRCASIEHKFLVKCDISCNIHDLVVLDIPDTIRYLYSEQIGVSTNKICVKAVSIIAELCILNAFDDAEWFASICKKRGCQFKFDDIASQFRLVCANGNDVSICKMLELLGMSRDNFDPLSGLQVVCQFCTVDLVKKYVGMYDIDIENVHGDAKMSTLLVELCGRNSNHGVIEFVCGYCTPQDGVIDVYGDVFAKLCGFGNLYSIKWFASKFNVEEKLARYDRNYALCNAAHNGHFEIVKWLVGNFHIDDDDITPVGDTFGPLIAAIYANQTEIVTWFFENFSFACLHDAPERANNLVKAACQAGDKVTLARLVDLIGPSYKPISKCGYSVLAAACFHGETEIAEWLIEKFGEQTFRKSFVIYRALEASCDERQFRTAKWLVNRFHISETAQRAMYYSLLIESIDRVRTEAVNWIAGELHIEKIAKRDKVMLHKRYHYLDNRCTCVTRFLSRIPIDSDTRRSYDDTLEIESDTSKERMTYLLTGLNVYEMSLDD